MNYTHYYEHEGNLNEWDEGTNLVKMKAEADKWAKPQFKDDNTFMRQIIKDNTFMRQIIKDSTGKIVYDVGPGSKPILGSLEAMNAKIKADNEAFDKLPKYKQRIEVAKDVLKWMAMKKLTLSTGKYFDITDNIARMNRQENNEGSMKDTLLSMKSCIVCAKGAVFACTVARKNEVKNCDEINWVKGNKLSETLQGLFSGHQLRMIETEFESDDIEYRNMDYTEKRKTKRIHCKMKFNGLDDATKMTRIMKNIIDNKGWFRP